MKVAYQSIRRGLTGLEFATGIPGTIGGMIYMNAGSHGMCMSDILENIKALYYKKELSPSAYAFAGLYYENFNIFSYLSFNIFL